MSFLLDTDICSAALKNDRRLFSRFVQYMGRLFTSRIVLVELYEWAQGSPMPQRRFEAIEKLLADVEVVEFDDEAAKCCGSLRRRLRSQGMPVPEMDALIASQAAVLDYTVVTHNTRDFANIPNLRVVDWLAP